MAAVLAMVILVHPPPALSGDDSRISETSISTELAPGSTTAVLPTTVAHGESRGEVPAQPVVGLVLRVIVIVGTIVFAIGQKGQGRSN